jgi:hypothetical protein
VTKSIEVSRTAKFFAIVEIEAIVAIEEARPAGTKKKHVRNWKVPEKSEYIVIDKQTYEIREAPAATPKVRRFGNRSTTIPPTTPPE